MDVNRLSWSLNSRLGSAELVGLKLSFEAFFFLCFHFIFLLLLLLFAGLSTQPNGVELLYVRGQRKRRTDRCMETTLC